MSGIIVVALAALLVQEAPHPSSAQLYQPPTIRPFEATATAGPPSAEGDAEAETHRAPLSAPVEVDAYVRSYEFSPTDADRAYDDGVASAEQRADQSAGPLDGRWRLVDGAGRILFDIALRDDGGNGVVEGAFRPHDEGQAGVVVAGDAPQAWRLGDAVLTLDTVAGDRRGTLTRNGRSTPVRLVRP